MNSNNEANRRMRNEGDEHEDIKATVQKARSFVEMELMTEAEALKYFNLPKSIYEQFKADA